MWIDVVFWILIALFAIIGLSQGLFDSILSLLGTGLAVVAGVFLAKPAAGFLNKIINIPAFFEKLLNKAFENTENIEIWENVFSKKDMAAFLSLVFAGFVVFVLIKLAIWLLAKLFESVSSKSTIASGLNKLFGLIFGLVKGGFIVCVLLAVCSILTGTQIFGNTIDNAIDNSTTTKWVYNYIDKFTEDSLKKVDIKEFLQDLITQDNDDNSEDTSQVQSEYQISIEIPNNLIN